MTEDTDAQAMGMRPADDPVGARAGVPGPADGRHADVVTLRDPRPDYDGLPEPKASRYELAAAVIRDAALDFNDHFPSPGDYDRRILLLSLTSAARELAAVRADATRTAEAEVAGLRKHPHDGYAYDGCVCVCCLNVRALAIAAQPAAPEPPVCTCYPGTDEHDYSCPTAWAARNPRPPEPDRTEALVNALVKNIQDALVHLEHEHYGWAIQSLDAALAAQPAAPHEPERFTGQMTWPCVCGHIKGAHYFGDALGADGQMHTWCQMNVIGGHCTDFRPAPEAEPERCAYILPSFTDPCRRPRESAVHDAVYGSKAHHSFTPEPR